MVKSSLDVLEFSFIEYESDRSAGEVAKKVRNPRWFESCYAFQGPSRSPSRDRAFTLLSMCPYTQVYASAEYCIQHLLHLGKEDNQTIHPFPSTVLIVAQGYEYRE